MDNMHVVDRHGRLGNVVPDKTMAPEKAALSY